MCSPPAPDPSTLPRKHLDSQTEETPNPKSPPGASNNQEALACLCPPSVTPGPQSDPPATQRKDPHLQQGTRGSSSVALGLSLGII